jgi:hypothetical protein
MGFNTGGGAKTYLKISDGKISVRVNEGTSNAIKCSNKDGSKTWWERRYSSFTGKIIGVSKHVSSNPNYSDSLCLEIDDKGEQYELQMPWSSGYATGFFLAMPNIHFEKELTICPWMKIVDDKKKTSLYFNLEGQKESVKWAWTKDIPGECPQMEQKMFKGKMVWDDSERQKFFEDYLEKNIKPKFLHVQASKEPDYSEIKPDDNEIPLPTYDFTSDEYWNGNK